MAGDNSFERQMIDFYDYKKVMNSLLDWTFEENKDKLSILDMAKLSIMCDIAQKYSGISKDEMERQKNILQIELYAQLERDRNKKPSNN